MPTTLNQQSPWVRRLWAYLQERFPPFNHGLLIVSYYSSNQFLAQVLDHPGQPVRLSQSSLAGAATLLCMFFHLRVFDEHKDYAEDVVHYPRRILSRGLFTLRDLKWLGGVAIGLELLLALRLGPAALAAVALALGYSLLMLKEFFVGRWLRRHFLAYTATHMLIMPLFALIPYSFTTGKWPWQAPGWFWLYAFVGFFVTLNWEVSRKIRAPEDEIAGVDSYSRVLGPDRAAWLVILVRMIDTAMVSVVGWHLGLSHGFYGVLAVLFLVCLNGFLQFRRHPCAQTAKRMETYAGMYIVAFDLTLAIAIAHKFTLALP